uniref:Uncharacterized protein n=1 Tax=Xiphophorus couchianus TaxID=32473 RepID=A0A3B5MVL0_9TELE
MEDWDAIPTVVPSNDSPLFGSDRVLSLEDVNKPGAFILKAYMMSWALSWRRRGSSSLLLHSRKLLSVSVALLSTRILSRSLQTSRPVSATRTFSGR